MHTHLGGAGKRKQEFKVNLSYEVSSKSAYGPHKEAVSKKEKS